MSSALFVAKRYANGISYFIADPCLMPVIKMDYSIVMAKGSSRILASYFHTPSVASQRLFHTVLRAGHVQTAPDYGVKRQSYPGHDLLLCIAGAGFVRCNDRVFPVTAGQLAWIDCHHPHAHWTDPSRPWELLWVRVDGMPSRRFAKALGVRDRPLFDLRDSAAAGIIFKHIFALLRERPPAIDAALHAAVAASIALLFEARLLDSAHSERGPLEERTDFKLRAVLANMRLHYRRSWKVEELARLSGLSVPHFFRRFRKATGSSPMDWLRRERMNQAKRRLSESRDRIRDIAEQVGYGDQFYFSRDFKKLVGLSPRQYRKQEGTKSEGETPKS
jgi:AraC-like DNA-binding protein